jgi:hypothetical protein
VGTVEKRGLFFHGFHSAAVSTAAVGPQAFASGKVPVVKYQSKQIVV